MHTLVFEHDLALQIRSTSELYEFEAKINDHPLEAFDCAGNSKLENHQKKSKREIITLDDALALDDRQKKTGRGRSAGASFSQERQK